MVEERKKEVLDRLIELADKLDRNGTLDLLEGVSEISTEALTYLTDPRILKIWANIAYLLHVFELIDPTIVSVMGNNLSKHISEEFKPEVFKDPPKLGPMGIIKMLNDKDVQVALGFIFLFLKTFGKTITTSGKQLSEMMDMMEKQFEVMRKQRKELGI